MNSPKLSHNFNTKPVLTRAILEAIQKSTDDSRNLEMVQSRLKESLIGRKFLLVLDDVWNEHRDQWKSLQSPLKYGDKGSKILITTRINKVASIMESNNIHQLKQLQKDHSWQVFAKHAFQDDNSKSNSGLKEVGMKIVEKCQGMPLALETVGGLLQSKSSISEWEGVLRSNIWELPIEDSKIMPALLLSYYHLPSHLKRCFAYCALFPKDHVFDKENLILSWMAENFLQCSQQQSKSPEEVGEQYFNDMLSRSFFQNSIIQDIMYNKTRFVMHDLLNDLAKYVSGEMCYRLGVDRPGSVPKTTRHFSTIKNPVECDEYRSLCEAKRLRTFVSGNCEMSIQDLISNFKFLRILSLSSHFIREVPDTIADLIHLRSLNLSRTGIHRLPVSICSLYNLQVLRLNWCELLKELPSTLHELSNLRRLELIRTSLRKAPVLLGKLKNLQVWMSEFEVGKSSSEFSIQQLGQLDVRGEVSIKNLENIGNPCDALAADLKRKTHLVSLCLQWNLKRNNDDSVKEREILENLQPCRHLKELSIDGYGGTQFLCWLSDNSLLNVVSLTLKNFKHCLQLPSLGLLIFLKHLEIYGLDEIVMIDANFYGNSSCAFASLETLSFYDMKEWEEWQCMTGAFPSLRSLYLWQCPKLKGHLPEHLPHLKNLCIFRCEQLVALTPKSVEIEGMKMEKSSFDMIRHLLSHTPLKSFNISSCSGMIIPINHCYDFLVELYISKCCDSFTNFPLDLFPKLSFLSLDECDNLQMISQGHFHGHLKGLTIKKCSEFESFPNEGLFAHELKRFWIEGLEKLKAMPKRMCTLLPSLNELYISNCPGLELSEGCLPLNLKHISLLNCSKLVAALKKGFWGTNPSIQSLSIGKEDVECLPGEGLLPVSLTKLQIIDCPNLKKLDYRGLCHLSSLKTMLIENCPVLQCLPEEGLPETISLLEMRDCPLLKPPYKKEKGEDQKNIVHMRTIWICSQEKFVHIKDEAEIGNS
ncbi:putative disease resistance RPP13-like protein 1 isoform X2 [Phaseolus vulgaris]|uniref:putative disease resistance RPP13-like protein 1 isoform X2 n=1 Tax=Phaseolus vulgaris TaxID=3885 RepID=UPI0035CBFE66